MSESPYKEFRADGWPLCPSCGEDELWSAAMLHWMGDGPRPTLEACLAGDMTCYRCNWSSKREKIRQLLSRAREERCAPLLPAPRYDEVYAEAMAVMDSE